MSKAMAMAMAHWALSTAAPFATTAMSIEDTQIRRLPVAGENRITHTHKTHSPHLDGHPHLSRHEARVYGVRCVVAVVCVWSPLMTFVPNNSNANSIPAHLWCDRTIVYVWNENWHVVLLYTFVYYVTIIDPVCDVRFSAELAQTFRCYFLTNLHECICTQ